MFYSSGNWDTEAFDRPERFNLSRSPNPHLGFGGGGVHFCLGAHIARAQLRAIFGELLRQLPDIQAGDPAYVAGNPEIAIADSCVSCKPAGSASTGPSTISTGLRLLRPNRRRHRSPAPKREPSRFPSRAAMCTRRPRRRRRRRHRRRSPTRFPNRRPPNRRAGARPCASRCPRHWAMTQVRPRRPSRRPCLRSSRSCRARRRARTAIGRAVPAGGVSVRSAKADRALLSIRGRSVGAARGRRLARA